MTARVHDIIRAAAVSALALAAPAGHADACTAIRHEILSVDASHDGWTSAALAVRPKDVILVYASGRINVPGATPPQVSAKGLPDGGGQLEMKVGTGTIVPAGTRWFGSFRDYGTLRFRVAPQHHQGLSGKLRVNLVVIPSASFPDAVTLDGE